MVYLLGPRARRFILPSIEVRVWDVRDLDETRWLSVYLDSGLNSEGHFAKSASKRIRLVQHIRRLTRCIQDPILDLLTPVIRKIALPGIMKVAKAC